MKKKIIIALTSFSLLFFVIGLYALSTKNKACTKLDNLVKLHRIEILRGHLLFHIREAQSDLHQKEERNQDTSDTVAAHLGVMHETVNACFQCHHAEVVSHRLSGIRAGVAEYDQALRTVFATHAPAPILKATEDRANRVGMQLIAEVDALTTMTNRKLDERTAAAFKEIDRINRFLYLLMAAVPLLAVAFGAVFIRGFTHPITELLTATRKLKAGNLEYRVPRLRDEYGELASSFNEMSESLKQHCARMQWAEQLVVLGELAGGLAHEMKNPLAGIKASLELAVSAPSLDEENRESLRMSSEQLKRIEVLLKNLLNFARPPKPLSLLTDVNDVLDATLTLAQKHPRFQRGDGSAVAMIRDFAQGLPPTLADPLQLQQVFMNLLLNAADAMPGGGIVTVRTALDAASGSLRVTVRDTGHGIDEGAAEKIFQPFFTTKAAGTGLGLAISRRLVEQHGGDISADMAAGGGASFTVTLPVRTAPEAGET
jgi:signal transduction histidine kinase